MTVVIRKNLRHNGPSFLGGSEYVKKEYCDSQAQFVERKVRLAGVCEDPSKDNRDGTPSDEEEVSSLFLE